MLGEDFDKEFAKIDALVDRQIKRAHRVMWAVIVVGVLILGALGYVAWHFIAKVW